METITWIRDYKEDVASDMSAFHGVTNYKEHTAQWLLPKIRRLMAYKGSVRFTLEQEAEKRKDTPEGRAQASGGKVYQDPKKNTEAMQLGIFETAGG